MSKKKRAASKNRRQRQQQRQQEQKTTQQWLSVAQAQISRWWCLASILTAMVLALFFRIYYPYDHVFADGWVRFQQNDPWFHMRVTEEFVRNFPVLPGVDALGLHPDGLARVTAPLLDIIIGSAAWVLGAGHPSTSLIETVGALTPAIMGGLLVIPVYFIGKTLFSRTAGVIGALLVAILPGELMFRTLLGFTDHHALEILASTTFIAFFVAAMKQSAIRWGIFAGIALGLYLASWTGGALFIFVALASVVAWYVVAHMRGWNLANLWKVLTAVFVSALVTVAAFWNTYALWDTQVAALLVGALTPAVLHYLSSWFKTEPRILYPLMIALLAGIAMESLRVISPELVGSAISQLSAGGGRTTISEVKGMSLSSAWEFFGPAFYVSMIALVLVAHRAMKSKESTLLLIWSLLMLIAAFSQQRFAYYLGVNVAILTGYLSWLFLRYVVGETKEGRRESLLSPRTLYSFIALIIIFFTAFFPQIGNAVDWSRAPRGPSDDWHETLTWIGNSTPEGDYGVMSWWDPGYWITYIGNRAPNAIPGGQRGAVDAANFLLAQNEAEADIILDKLGTRYVILDTSNSVVQFDGSNVFGEFYAFVAWANRNNADYYEICYLPSGQNLTPLLLYYPSYYQSMSTRLYIFGGNAWIPYSTEVVKLTTQNVTSNTGVSMKVNVIQDSKTFTQYSEALAFVAGNGEYRIVGREFGMSPVPLQELEKFELVHQSPTVALSRGDIVVTAVEVFEYTAGN